MWDFINLCKLSQTDLKSHLADKLLEHFPAENITSGDGYLYAEGTIPILLVAHLDTVHKELPRTILYDEESKIISSPEGIGGDDRAGVYILLEVLRKHNCSVLFCEDALPMVRESDYPQVLADYQARKAAEAAAEEALSYVTLNASSVAKKSESGKRSMQITWTADGIGLPEDVDGYEVWKSTSRDDGYTLSISTAKMSYKNTSGLKKGTRYYYKVRAYKQIGEKRIYSAWSNIT